MKNQSRSNVVGNQRPNPPSFDAGLIAEPLLAFGGQHTHIDPKTGLALYGPYSPSAQDRPGLQSIAVGCVGPANMLADAERWLDACKRQLRNAGEEPFLHPQFPGFNSDYPFLCELRFGDPWREAIPSRAMTEALNEPDYFKRIRKIIALYIEAIDVLAGREPRPNVIVCCIPQEVIDYCTVRVTKAGETKRRKVSPQEKQAKETAEAGQTDMFDAFEATSDIEGSMGGHENLRRGLKADAMRLGIPTQLVWPRTLRLTVFDSDAKDSDSQDIATRAWNFTTALYHKAGGTPWRLASIPANTCFAGVSFYRDLADDRSTLRTAMAQVFTSAGDGYVLKGRSFEWDERARGRSPHLDENTAAALLQDVLDLYKRQNRGSLPNRVVLHKSSRFDLQELKGFSRIAETIPQHDFVTLGWRGLQFYRPGDYPPLRGTFVKLSDSNMLLYTTGYIPFLRTYPGARVPQPLEILEHHGDSPWTVVLEEVMALTKMNWNTAAFACNEPITIAFSRRVGEILAELGHTQPMRPEYRFYM